MTAKEYISICKKILLELKNILTKFNHKTLLKLGALITYFYD